MLPCCETWLDEVVADVASGPIKPLVPEIVELPEVVVVVPPSRRPLVLPLVLETDCVPTLMVPVQAEPLGQHATWPA